jgi:hypothetical protein
MRNTLLPSVAAAALLAGMSAVYAESIDLTIDDVNQVTSNTASVTNNGDINHNLGDISGNGASLSISATGAVSSLSVSSINAPEFNSVSIGTYGNDEVLFQSTSNSGAITNNHAFDTLTWSDDVSGDGASVSVSAIGGASAISLSSINNQARHWGNQVEFGGIQQNTVNSGKITNNGGSLITDDITGDGASVSIGASGAVSSVSVSSIVDQNQVASVLFSADINQTTSNTGAITNTGTISVGDLSGQGASASVSAIGAASAVSFSTIK